MILNFSFSLNRKHLCSLTQVILLNLPAQCTDEQFILLILFFPHVQVCGFVIVLFFNLSTDYCENTLNIFVVYRISSEGVKFTVKAWSVIQESPRTIPLDLSAISALILLDEYQNKLFDLKYFRTALYFINRCIGIMHSFFSFVFLAFCSLLSLLRVRSSL